MAPYPHIPVTALKDATENFESLSAFLTWGVGSPLNVVGAPVGALFLRLDGGANTTLYVKESAASSLDSAGWVAK